MPSIKSSIYLIPCVTLIIISYFIVYLPNSQVISAPTNQHIKTENIKGSEPHVIYSDNVVAKNTNFITQNPDSFIDDLSHALTLDNAHKRIAIIKSIIKKALEVDDLAIYYWLLEQKPTTETGEYFQYFLQHVIPLNIRNYSKLIHQLPELDAKQSIINDYVIWLTQVDPEQALTWSFNLSAQYLDSAQAHIFKQWAMTSPSDALEHLSLYNEINHNVKQEILANITNQLANYNPIELANNIDLYPAEFQAQLIYSVIANWPYSELESALEFIDTINRVDIKDQAIKSYVDYVGGKYLPEKTIRLASQMSEPQLRLEIMSQVYIEWLEAEPTVALNSIKNTDLTAVEKNYILQQKPIYYSKFN